MNIGRKERERRMRREMILQAAESIFARKGYSGATMEEVAKSSEFGMSTLYKFFRSKVELYSAIIDEKLSRLQESLVEVKGMELHWRNAIERFVQDYLRFFQENTNFFKIYMTEKFGSDYEPKEELYARAKARIASYVEHAESELRDWIEEGHLGSSGSRARALALLSTIETYLSRWLGKDSDASPDEEASFIMNVLFAPANTTQVGAVE
ncbi:MAG TPA: TetR/AcrR family transcriptional regulator [bacterium]|nr:TetR/AcrR family transcriptional regulator [bacterium]